MSELLSEFENVSKESISQKLTEMNCSGYQKTIIEEIVSAAKVMLTCNPIHHTNNN